MKSILFKLAAGFTILLGFTLCLTACGTAGTGDLSFSADDSRFASVDITDNHDGSYSCNLFAMDTVMQLKAYGGREATKALSDSSEEILRLDRELNVTNEESPVYALNHRSSSTVSGDAALVLEESLRLAELTGGTFDPTIYPVVRAWGFTTQQYRIAEDSEIEELLPHIGYGKVNVSQQGSDTTVSFDDDQTEIDTGGIGKGYASEKIYQIMTDHGISSAVVSLGGNVMTLGKKPDGSHWNVAVEDPFDSGGSNYAGIIRLVDKYAITSGGYQRFFEEGGKTYIHIMDPSTGYPVDNDLASVTIISDSGTEGDALSTALYVMGLDGAIDFWKTSELDFDMILITSDREVCITETIADDFSTENQDYRKIRTISR